MRLAIDALAAMLEARILGAKLGRLTSVIAYETILVAGASFRPS